MEGFTYATALVALGVVVFLVLTWAGVPFVVALILALVAQYAVSRW